MMHVVIKLNELLKEKGISQRSLSRDSNVRLATINEMCKQETKYLPLDNLAAICEVLECEIADILKLQKNH
ncbi:helix-turn-helix domain-containing protein [Jeotgalibacillus alimentarius]|uniref:helix-turn-helix domain-containing protein n=1 Tax=Jeotgalibacillus alimentarius TaxID=135826 RepID=UPI000597318B|nr:helix-turn-helix transcriptional regulator [Jeotgalibacillus alimentarius]